VHLHAPIAASVDVCEIGGSCCGTSEYHQYEKERAEGVQCCPVSHLCCVVVFVVISCS